MPAEDLLRPPAASAAFSSFKKTSKPRERVFSQKGAVFSAHCCNQLPSLSSYGVENAILKKRGRWRLRTSPLPLAGGLHGKTLSAAVGGDGEVEAGGGEIRDLVVRVGDALSMAFPLWVNSACLLALWRPPSFLWVGRTSQIVGLTLTMLGMGMTLTLDDLRGALLMPRELAAGGTASNIVTYLARGNVALSVLMTAASTFSAAVMTPFLTSKLAGQYVAVDPAGLSISTVQVVLAPVLLGAVLNQYCNNLVKFVSPVMPPIAVATVAILCGSAIAQNASAILASGLQVVLAVFALHASGFFFGYVFSKLLGIDDSSARTISIEVGMQNSVLGVVHAGQHFGNPLTAVPCAVSSICQSIYGSALAAIWRSMPVETKVED